MIEFSAQAAIRETKNYLRLKGNEPKLLDDSDFWLVQSGSLALFVVTLEGGIASGVRHYLLSVGPQEALFGFAPSSGERQFGVLAVAVTETTLQCIAKSSADTNLVEGWIHRLGYALHEALVRVFPQQLVSTKFPDEYISLAEGQIFAPEKDTVSWIKLQQGHARLMGFEELTLSPESRLLPLSASMWLEAVGKVDLAINNTAALLDANLWQGITHLQELSLRLFDLLQQQESVAEQQRFQEREKLNHQVTTEALEELTSVLQPRKASFFTADTDLLLAAGAVGKALGITILPPAKSENLERVKNPLESTLR